MKKILISLIILSPLLFSFDYCSRYETRKYINEIVSQCPVRVDERTLLKTMRCLNNTLYYIYIIEVDSSYLTDYLTDKEINELEYSIYNFNKNFYCSNNKALQTINVSVNYLYIDINGNRLYNFEITPFDCN